MSIIERFQNAEIGSLVKVDDVDLIIEASDNVDLKGKLLNFLVKEVNSYEEDGAGFEILLLDHVGSDVEYLLVCSHYNGISDIKLYSRPEFFTPNSRNVLVNSENGWLFDGESYPDEIYSDDIVYKKKFQNEVYQNTTIVEWVTESKIVNYELLVIETGSTNQYGGWVEFYEGRQIKEKDVTL